MKNLVILYGGDLTDHAFEKIFGSSSAFERVLEWGQKFSDKIILLTKNNSSLTEKISSLCSSLSCIEVISKDSWTKSLFISEIASLLQKNNRDSAIISYADTPFLNENLTSQLIEMHEKYCSEYTFADGFPYGLAPELLEKGTASILCELAKSNLKSEGEKAVDREALFSVIRGDINSFEIETLVADEDYRLLRFNFESSSKINMLACKNLYEEAQSNKIDLSDPYLLSNFAAKTSSVMQTLPAFYNIQISSKFNHKYCYSLSSINKNPCERDFMSLADFKKILNQIVEFSENCTISLSAFGEPLLHPDFMQFAESVIASNDEKHKVSLLIEGDGLLISDEIASKISSLASSKNAEVNWIIYIDAVEKSMYSKLHNCDEGDFEKALYSIPLLEKYFEGHVYPQFTRLETNESQLESFYRFWKEKESPSRGELVIQKYNSVCNLLPDLKSADLSPVNRLPCWHLRRDMTVLADGGVPYCFQLSFSENAGNILTEEIEKVWRKIGEVLNNHLSCHELSESCHCQNPSEQSLPANCGICDESYTFNF